MRSASRKEDGEKGKRKAPRFYVLLRLYRLVSPALGLRLCSFQKLQSQSPADAWSEAGGERETGLRESGAHDRRITETRCSKTQSVCEDK